MNPKKRRENSNSSTYSSIGTKYGSINTKDNKIFSTKKAQVTVFIVIGIIILFAFAGVMYFTKKVVKEEVTAEGEPVIQSVPQEFVPLQTYTENCIQQVGKRGLLILGEQGGYIYPEVVGEYSPNDPTNSDGINLEPLRVPYWHYNAVPNDKLEIKFASLQPRLYAKDDPELSIESQLSRFVEEKIDGCLEGYRAFAQQGFDIFQDETKNVAVNVGEESVGFLLQMSLDARKGKATNSFEKFYVKMPLKLKHYYDVASLITETQREHHFLERQGMELISVYAQRNREYLAPISDSGFEYFSTLSWQESDLKEKHKGLLTSYIPMLRFLGSSNFYYYVYPEGHYLTQKLFDNMVLPLTGAEDLNINFDYFGWETYFKTNSKDGIVQPDHFFINYEILNFGYQRYETNYDTSYPLLVSLEDEFAFAGDGYKFNFALETNIRNNQPAIAGEGVEPYPRTVSSLACNEEQKVTEPIRAVVVDSFTKEPIEMVKVGFTIPEQDECEVGFTDKEGEIEDNYPAVYGGVLNFIHPEYLTNFYPIDTYKYQDQAVLLGYAVSGADEERAIELDRIVTKNITMKQKQLKKCLTPLLCDEIDLLLFSDISCEKAARRCFFNEGDNLFLGDPVYSFEANGSLGKYGDYYFFNRAQELAEDQEVLITLERVKGFHDETIGGSFIAVASVKGGEVKEVELVPGIYKVTIISTVNKELVVPAEKRCFQYDILTREEQECVDFMEQKTENYANGNLVWDTQKSYLEITPEKLYGSDEITFYALTQDIYTIPKKIRVEDYDVPGLVVEDLQVFGRMAELSRSAEIREALEPRFS